MKKAVEKYWKISENLGLRDIEAALKGNHDINTYDRSEEEYSLLDDADWSIWRSGAVLVKTKKGTMELHHKGKVDVAEKVSANIKFWWELPVCELREAVKSYIKLRAVTAQSAIKISRICHDVLNEDLKIVVRANITLFQSENYPGNHSYLAISPLTGYSKEFEQVHSGIRSSLCENDILPAINPPDLKQLFCDAGLVLPTVDGKKFGISANEATENAIRKMSKDMLGRALRQKEGIISDIDTEFLHDYRVNLRKARSLISLTRNTLVQTKCNALRANLSQLASKTNTLRDLDVFVLDERVHRGLLPIHYLDGLNEFFKLLRRERQAEFKRVVKFLSSQQFESLSRAIGTELERDPDYATETSLQPVKKFVQKKIMRRHLKICQLAQNIHVGTVDNEIHEVRIECKKLRYLMEFFAELFPRARMKKLVQKLKKLQNVLGRFNDHSVQQGFLCRYTEGQQYSQQMVAAVNALIGVLHQKQLEQRRLVHSVMGDFVNDMVKAEFQLLFGKQNMRSNK